MAGLPHHAVDAYVGKLLAAGKKVAICDQDEPAQPGRLVRRKLTRILSAGTTLAANQLEAASNRYLCAVSLDTPGASRRMDRAVDRGVQGRDGAEDRGPAPGPVVPRPGGVACARGRPRALEGRAARGRGRPRPARLRRGPDRDRASRIPLRGGRRGKGRRRGDRRPQPRGFRAGQRASGARAGRRPCRLRHGQPLREAGEPEGPAGVPERAHAPPGPGDPAQPGDLLVGARRPAGVAPRSDRRDHDGRRLPPAGALARSPGASIWPRSAAAMRWSAS